MAKKPRDFKSASLSIPDEKTLAYELANINSSSCIGRVLHGVKEFEWGEATGHKSFYVNHSKIDRVYKYRWNHYQSHMNLYVRMNYKEKTLHMLIDAAAGDTSWCYIVFDPKVFVIAFLGRDLQGGNSELQNLLKEDGYLVTDEELTFYLDYQWNWKYTKDAPSLQLLCKLALFGKIPEDRSPEELGPTLTDDYYMFEHIRLLTSDHMALTKRSFLTDLAKAFQRGLHFFKGEKTKLVICVKPSTAH